MNSKGTKNNNASDSNIFIVNRYPPMSSPYRYAEDVFYSLDGKAEWINLIFDRKGWEKPHKGIDFQPAFGHVAFINHTFRDLSFHQAIRYVESKGGNNLIHYTNQFSGILKVRGARRIISIHDSPYYIEKSGTLNSIFMRRLFSSLKDEEYVITQTEHLKNELRQFGFSGNIYVIYLSYSTQFRPLGVNKYDLRKSLNLPADRKLIMSVSSDLPRKNLAMVDKVMKSLGGGYRLVRVGSPLGNSINFSGIDDQVLNMIYNASDVLLFPSLYEGFGLPIVESFASGLPVVTSDIPTIREVSGGAAILADPLDFEALRTAVRDAIDRKEELYQKGIERAKNFTFEVFKKKMLKVYGELTDPQ